MTSDSRRTGAPESLTGIESAAEPAPATPGGAAVLAEAIERVVPDLQRSVEVLVAKHWWGIERGAIAEVAAEIVHEAVARAMQKADQYDATRPAHAWVFRFAFFVLREQIRARQRDRAHQTQPVAPEPGADPDVDSIFDRIEDRRAESEYRLIDLLDLVSPADRRLLTLRIIERMDYAAMAAHLGTREGTIRVQISRALKRLARANADAERSGKGDR